MESNNPTKVKLMISYGGRIQHRPHDHRLSYLGGDTKILSVDRHVSLSDVVAKLTSLTRSPAFFLKYQLPGEDLDALVSVINDDDLENMLAEYDRVQAVFPTRLRLFLFPKPDPNPTQSNPDYLFGFDKEFNYASLSYPDAARPELLKQNPENVDGEKKAYPHESQVTANGGYAVRPPMGQPVYLIPVTGVGAGQFAMPAVRIVYPDQPVYSYVAPMTATKAAPKTT